MPVTATGSFGIPLANLAALLASCPEFISETGAQDAADAEANYVRFFSDETVTGSTPGTFGFIGSPQAVGRRDSGLATGEIPFALRRTIPVGENGSERDRLIGFMNWVDAIVAYLLANDETSGLLSIREVILDEVVRSSKAEEANTAPYLLAFGRVAHGIEGMA